MFWATALITFVNTVIAVFSIVREAFVVEHGWDPVEVNLAMSVYLVFLALSGIVAGRIADRVGVRTVIYVGAVLFGGGWFMAGFAGNVGELYFWLGVVAGIGCGATYNPVIATALRWFPDRHGLVSGSLLAAGAIGPAVLAAGLAAVVAAQGIGTGLHLLGLVLFLFTAAPGWLIRPPAASPPPVADLQEAIVAPVAALRPSAPFRTSRFWLIFVLFAVLTTPGNMIVSSLASITRTQVGGENPVQAAGLATLMVTILPLANVLGRLLFGVIYDRWGGFRALALCWALTTLSLLGLVVARDPLSFAGAVLLLGLAFGSTLVIFPPLTGREFGMAGLGFVYGVMFLAYALGGIIGPVLAGAMASGGSADAYVPAYLVALVLCAVGAAVLVVLRRRRGSPESARLA